MCELKQSAIVQKNLQAVKEQGQEDNVALVLRDTQTVK
jgi:hypothetical protein